MQHTADRSLLLLISSPPFMHMLLSIASTGRDTGLRCLVMQLLVDWASATHSPNDEFVPAYAKAKQVRACNPLPATSYFRVFTAPAEFILFSSPRLLPRRPCRVDQSPSSSARGSVSHTHTHTPPPLFPEFVSGAAERHPRGDLGSRSWR